MRWPLDSFTITQHYNPQHQGTDLGGNPVGTPIKSPASGVVVAVGEDVNYLGGKYIIVRSGGYDFYMGHNSRNIAKTNQKVNKGDIIAEVGDTGSYRPQGFGPHVHFQIRCLSSNTLAIDPEKFLVNTIKEEDVKINDVHEAKLLKKMVFHRDVSDAEVSQDVGRTIRQLYDQFLASPEWLTVNHYILVLPGKFDALQKQLAALEESNKRSDLVKLKERMKQISDELEQLSK